MLAPHPDDEVLGCGGTIAQKVRAGDDVHVVYLTDGSHGVQVPADTARALREEEAREAAAVLGLRADQLVFLGIEDGHLAEAIVPAAGRVREMLTAFGVDDVFVPYRREYHRDHLAAWQIGRRAVQDHVTVYEYPIWYGPWLWRDLSWSASLAAMSHLFDAYRMVRVDITAVAEVKRQALAAYRSQLAAFEARGERGTRFLANFAGGCELFFRSQ